MHDIIIKKAFIWSKLLKFNGNIHIGMINWTNLREIIQNIVILTVIIVVFILLLTRTKATNLEQENISFRLLKFHLYIKGGEGKFKNSKEETQENWLSCSCRNSCYTIMTQISVFRLINLNTICLLQHELH